MCLGVAVTQGTGDAGGLQVETQSLEKEEESLPLSVPLCTH